MYCMNCGTMMNESDSVCPNCSYPTKLIKLPDTKPALNAPSENMGYVQIRQANGSVALQPVAMQPARETSTAAVLGMVLGIVSILTFFGGFMLMVFLGIPLGTIGFITSMCGLSACDKQRKTGKAFAITGMVCSLICLAPWLLVLHAEFGI